MHRIYNLGNNRPERLSDFISILERELGRKAEKILEPRPPEDVPETYADFEASSRDFGYAPKTNLDTGLKHFIRWFKAYHKVA